MFVVVISFPPIKKDKDADFKEWFLPQQTMNSQILKVSSEEGF